MSERVYIYMNPGDGPIKLDHFPKLTEEDLTAANDLFQHYIFFKTEKSAKKLWTSCCQRESAIFPLMQRTEDEGHREIAYGVHNDQVTCPFCGRKATLKNIGKIGKGKKLKETVPVVFLKAVQGSLYAEGFWMWKSYAFNLSEKDEYGDDAVNLRPLFKATRCYIFRPGQAVMYERDYEFGWCEVSEQLYPPGGRRKVCEPLTEGAGMYERYCDYHVIGIDVIQESAFRYCQYMEYHRARQAKHHPATIYAHELTHRYLIRYLVAASLYPRAVEMLFKGGLTQYIDDLIDYKRKNHDCIRWTEEDPRKAFGLTAQELKAYLAGNRNIGTLRFYKKFKREKMPVSFAEVAILHRELPIEDYWEECIRFQLKPMKFLKYLQGFEGPRCHGMGYVSVNMVFKQWQDYINAAVRLEYDMANETVLLPNYLEIAHDNAVGEQNRREYQEEAEETKRNLEVMVKRFTFEIGEYIIRPALTGQEIVAEGKALEHCVGGYAKRHMQGALSICFLRMKDNPEKPLVTIELDKDGHMKQVHGYKNDRGTTPAKQAYDHIIAPWLKWIAEGSKRDKEGKPILDKPARARKKKEDHAA